MSSTFGILEETADEDDKQKQLEQWLVNHRCRKDETNNQVQIDKTEGKEKNEESEIEDLRYRISQLEHLIVTPQTHTTNSNTYNYASISLIPPPAYSSSIINKQDDLLALQQLRQNYDYDPATLFSRINQLESLLAGSEIDNQNLQEQIQLHNASKNHQRMELLEQIKQKDLDLIKHEENIKLLEMKDKASTKKLSTIQDYINTLPSQEELDELMSQVEKLNVEKDYLINRIEQYKLELNKTQKELIHKEHKLQNALTKIEELKPFEEAQEALLNQTSSFMLEDISACGDSTKITTSYFSNEQNVINLVTVQKAQLINSKKIVKALRTKLGQRNIERNELLLKLAGQVKCFAELQEQLNYLQIEHEAILEKEKRGTQMISELQNECTALKETIKNLENFNLSKQDERIKLIHLVTQVELCFNELQQLTQVCQSICNGQEPSIEQLIGFSNNHQDKLEVEIESNNADEEDNLSLEWILQNIVSVCQLRQDLHGLRNRINNLYTDTLAQDVDKCNVQ